MQIIILWCFWINSLRIRRAFPFLTGHFRQPDRLKEEEMGEIAPLYIYIAPLVAGKFCLQ